MPKIKDTFNPSLERITDELQTKVTREAFLKFRATTPKRSGNARRKTTLNGNKIRANYNYATQLDAGKSRQAPQGMTEPTSKVITRAIEKIMRK